MSVAIYGVEKARRAARVAERVKKLEALQKRVAEMVLIGEEKYVAGALGAYARAEERIAKYEGLDAPDQMEQTVTTISPDLAEMVRAAREAEPDGE